MAKKRGFNIIDLVNSSGCFDLQFRKDTRHERTNSPTYYRWKAQFVITAPKENIKVLQKVKNNFSCGSISTTKNQARFSVQKIDDIVKIISPYFNKNKLAGKKRKDFEMWQKAFAIIYRNKGIYISKWKKNDLSQLMEIHKVTAKYKYRVRKPKWIQMAHSITKLL